MIGDKRPEPRARNLKGEVKCLENCKCPPLRSEFYLLCKCHCWVKDNLETKGVFQLETGDVSPEIQEKPVHEIHPLALTAAGWALGLTSSCKTTFAPFRDLNTVPLSAGHGSERLCRERGSSPSFPTHPELKDLSEKELLSTAPSSPAALRDCQVSHPCDYQRFLAIQWISGTWWLKF